MTTKIEWVVNPDGSPGEAWNPVTGCTKVSPGCKNCYAERFAKRFWGEECDCDFDDTGGLPVPDDCPHVCEDDDDYEDEDFGFEDDEFCDCGRRATDVLGVAVHDAPWGEEDEIEGWKEVKPFQDIRFLLALRYDIAVSSLKS